MDKRLHSRVDVEPQCKARFRLGGQTYDNITVSNLGQDGCCLVGSTHTLAALNDKVKLESWELLHPGLPKGAIKAKVVWVRGQDKLRTGTIETGIKFMNAPAAYTLDLARYVSAVARPLFTVRDDMD